jgi:hypothetical protein
MLQVSNLICKKNAAIMMKANFNIKKNDVLEKIKTHTSSQDKELSQEEFEEFIVKSGAKGSFMVYRSSKKDDEMGLDSL